MTGVFIFLLSILSIYLIGKLHTSYWSKRETIRRFGHQMHFAHTTDGWHLSLHRYLPGAKRYVEPVFLCHGLAANRNIFDLSKERSLAHYLAEHGFEVWTVELRGAGLSKTPAWLYKDRLEVGFSHYLDKDIPAVMDVIRKMSGSDNVFWIGHGLGGLLGYAWAGLREDHGLCGLVALCTSVANNQTSALRKFWPLMKMTPLAFGIAFRSLARFFAPFSTWSAFPLNSFFSVPGGLEGVMMRKWLINAVENTHGLLLRQVFSWFLTGDYGSIIGKVSDVDFLKKIKISVLIVASDKDRISPPGTVTPAYRQIAALDKQLRIFGNDQGDDFDFGHTDLLIGLQAPKLVYPELKDWLDKHAKETS